VDAIRTFVAIELPPAPRDILTAVQNRLQSLDLHASWVRPDKIHLTLRFLGDIDPRRVPELSQALQNSLATVPFFSVCLGPVGVFPGRGQPRVIWMGLEGGDSLQKVYRATEQALAGRGFPPEDRPFAPHLTLARIKSPRGLDRLRRYLERPEPVPPAAFPVREVTLFQSELNPRGSVYTPLAHFPLSA